MKLRAGTEYSTELDHHDAVWKDFVFVARFSFAYPKMVCPIAEREILVKPGLFL